MNVAERGKVNLLSCPCTPVKAKLIESGGGVRHHVGEEAQIATHPCRGRNTVLSRQTDDNKCVDSRSSQVLLKLCPDEAAVYAFVIHRFGIQGHRFAFRCMARGSRNEIPVWGRRVVMNVDDWMLGLSPCCKKPADIGLSVRIVSRSPSRISETLLYVDRHKCGAITQLYDDSLTKTAEAV